MVSGQLSKWIGAAVKRKEDPRLITGEGKYTGDVQLSGMTYMAVLRSPHAHAHIRRIETARALRQPGVLTVLTGQEVEQHCQMPFRLAGVREGMHTKSRWPMATAVAKYAGEPVAAVVATSRGRAQDALEMIEVDYESLPAVMDLEKAVEEGSPLVHEDLGTTYGVYTHKVPVGPYRGYGQHATAYVIERVMDLIAHALNMDPVEVRRQNFIAAEAFPYQTPTGREYDRGDYEAVLAKALQLAEYEGLREEQRRLRQQGRFMGIGIATTVDASGFGPSSALSARPGYEGATVRVDPTSKVTVLTGSSPHGQGMETTFAQIAADELGVPFEDVEVVYGDTSITPRGSGTRASRSLVVGGTAIVKAGERVKAKAVQIAGALLHIDPQYVTLEQGKFFVEDIPDRSVTWADVSREAYDPHHLPSDLERGLEATAYWEPLAYTYPCSASVAVVYIDTETGEVTLTKYIYVDDCGTVVNPLVVDGQVHGGLAQGIGAALLEEAIWDDSGQLLTGSFMDYALPSAAVLPRFTLGRVVTPSPHNPLGAKDMGESPTIAAPPAIVNAVVDALAHLGVTHIDMPIKPEKVWRILRAHGVAT